MKVKVVRYKNGENNCRSEFPVMIKAEMERFEKFVEEKKADGTFIEVFEQYV